MCWAPLIRKVLAVFSPRLQIRSSFLYEEHFRRVLAAGDRMWQAAT